MPSSGSLTSIETRPAACPGGLPEGYGETLAVLLPRDPDWRFAYWEITPASKARTSGRHGPDIFERSRQVLRIHDMTNSGGGHFDVPVLFDAGNWYVHVRDAGRSYCGELGLATPSGAFIGIVKSNTVTLPPGRVSDFTDERWMAVSPEFDKLLQLSCVEYIGRGSGEVAKSLAQRWEMLRSVFSRGASWGVSSMASLIQEKPQKKVPPRGGLRAYPLRGHGAGRFRHRGRAQGETEPGRDFLHALCPAGREYGPAGQGDVEG